MADLTDLRITRSHDEPLTPETTARPPLAVTVTCGSCARQASPKLERWRYGRSWTKDWTVVFAERAFRCRCGGAASRLLVTRDEQGHREQLLKIERSSPGSYSQLSGR